VFNLAIPGTGPDQQYLTWREAAAGRRADAVVVAIWVENIRRVVSHFRWFRDGRGGEQLFAKPWFELIDGRLSLHGSPPAARPVAIDSLNETERTHIAQRARLEWTRPLMDRARTHPLLGRLDVTRRVVEPVQRVARYQPVPEYANGDDVAWRLLSAIVEAWAGELDVPMLIMPLPFRHHVTGIADPSPYQARYHELAAACGAAYLDPLEAFAGLSRDERRDLYFADDGHPTARWHAIVGAALAPELARLCAPATPQRSTPTVDLRDPAPFPAAPR